MSFGTIPARPQPRAGEMQPVATPQIEIILLAAGASRRMRGRDKLLENIGGQPLLHLSAQTATQARVQKVHVILPRGDSLRHNAVSTLMVNVVDAPQQSEGMAASLRAGMRALSKDCDAVIIALADMPEITADHYERLIEAFDPARNRDICRAMAADGAPGLPVLFGRRFFEMLNKLHGDSGARDIIKDAPEYLVEVPTLGQAAVVDLDTPEAWTAWRRINGTHK